MNLTCSIVLYKDDKAILLSTIESLLYSRIEFKLFLIDNSPTKELGNIIVDDRIIYIHNPSNPGFGASHNIAIKKAIELNSTYHLVLNPDIYFDQGNVNRIIEFMELNQEIGHLMPKILFPDNSIQYLCKRNPTFFDLFARAFLPNFINFFFQKRLDRYTYKDYDYDKLILDVPYLSGCFMFLRMSTLKEVGYFDDKFFMYLEDADITRRFLQVSRTVYFPGAIVYHRYGGLTHKKWKYKLITIQSAFIYFNKWGWFKSIY
jgi:GT2 family glycosyltransferase